jgi:hypothetical protein
VSTAGRRGRASARGGQAPAPLLSDRALTASYLARQFLLERQHVPVAAAVRSLVALQAQYSPSPYLALHARLATFAQEDLEAALRERAVVKATLMRGTLHLVAAEAYPAFASAWHPQARAALRTRAPEATPREEALTDAIADFAATPRTTDELRACVRELAQGQIPDGILLDYARVMVPLIHVPPSGFWRQHGKPALVAWPGGLPATPEATALLIRRYLAAFGPATREDIAHFTYLRLRQIDPALASLEPLRRFTDAAGRTLLDVPDGLIVDDDRPLPVRFLARWDAAVISHRDRARIVPPAFQKSLMPLTNGTALASYLLDGRVAGSWSHQEEGGTATLTIAPFGASPAQLSAAFAAEAERLLRFLAPQATAHRLVVSGA